MSARPPSLLRRPSVQGALFILALLAAWQVASALGRLNVFTFPPPSRLVEAAYELATIGFPDRVRLWTHVGITLTRIFEGFGLAMVLAIPLGILIGRSETLEALLAPIITFARSIATLSLLPLAIIWFGIGERSKIFLIGYGCFWVMLSNVIAAVKYVDPMLVRAARTMDVSGLTLFRQVILPAALPRILAGARISLGVGFMVIVGAEMIGTIRGVGALIMEARTFYRTDLSMVGMMTLALIGLALTAGLFRIERTLLPWYRGLEEARR